VRTRIAKMESGKTNRTGAKIAYIPGGVLFHITV